MFYHSKSSFGNFYILHHGIARTQWHPDHATIYIQARKPDNIHHVRVTLKYYIGTARRRANTLEITKEI